MRRVISVWLPRLLTDRLRREEVNSGGLSEAPLVAVAAVQSALRVAGVSAGAQAHGITPGMTLADARALLPTLRSAPVDPAADLALLDRLAAWATRWTPWTAVDGLDGTGGGALWLDITGCAHLFARPGEDPETSLLRDLLERLGGLGFTARAGLGDTKGAAWAAARFLDPQAPPELPFAIIPDGAARQILPALPVAALRLDAATVETLRRLGLRTIGDLLAVPRGPLAARFGRIVAERLDQALGRAPEPFTPRQPPAPYRARLGFAEPIGLLSDVAAGLDHLLATLCARLERDGQGARRLELDAFRVDGTVSRATIGTARPVRDAAHLARLYRDRLQTLEAAFGIEALVLSIPGTDPLTAAQTGLAKSLNTIPQAIENEKDFALLIDRLRGRLGAAGVVRPVPRPSHIPERAVAAANPLTAPPALLWPPCPRPPHLLPRPERADASPALSGGTVPSTVPGHLRWRRQVLRVVRAEGPERLSPEWWAAPTGEARDYWRIEDAEGRRLWVFSQGDEWFVHGGLP